MTSTETQSLLDYLTESNPTLTAEQGCEGRNTTSRADTWVWPREITHWHDFELDSLNAIYGGSLRRVLESEFELQSFKSIPLLPYCEIHDENSFESLLVKWNHSTVSQALAVSQQEICNFWKYDKIFMVKGGQAQLPSLGKGKTRPDWAAIQRAAEDMSTPMKSPNILPGETKLSKNWHSSKIKLGEVLDDNIKAQWLLPIRQIYTYCLRCNVRYGYLITDKELVVIRVKPGSTNAAYEDSQGASVKEGNSQDSYVPDPDTLVSQTKSSGILEFKAIPWVNSNNTNNKNNGLTINLALWWLHMMAAKDSTIAPYYEPMCDEKLPSVDDEMLDQSFTVSDAGRELANTSLGQSFSGSFQSSASHQSNGRVRKRSRNREGTRGKKQKGKFRVVK